MVSKLTRRVQGLQLAAGVCRSFCTWASVLTSVVCANSLGCCMLLMMKLFRAVTCAWLLVDNSKYEKARSQAISTCLVVRLMSRELAPVRSNSLIGQSVEYILDMNSMEMEGEK